jgi:hypothetical protein
VTAAFVAAMTVALSTRLHPFLSVPTNSAVVSGGFLLGAGVSLRLPADRP